MKIQKSALDGVNIVETASLIDNRGMFSRLYCEYELSSVIGERHIVQINFSRTKQIGSVRGLHYQRPPHAEMKLVRCIKGRVWDVSLDMRTGSRTFLKWHAEELTPENGRMLIIPEGCAHGFQALEADTELLYLHTAYYNPKHEGGVLFNDPAFNIQWPLACAEISDRDVAHPKIDSHYQGIKL